MARDARPFVVGADGTLGARLVRALDGVPVERRASSLGDDARLPELADAEVVVNASGPRVRPGLGWPDYFREHAGLAAAIARSMRPGARLVHVSSTAVYGARGTELARDAAEAPTLFPSAPYACAKLAAEACVRAIGAERGLDVIVLRPSMVYGPGVDSALQTLRRLPIALRPRRVRQHLVHVDLLVRAVEQATRAPSPSERVLVVADPFVLTNADLQPSRPVRVPIFVDLAARLHRSVPALPAGIEALAVLALDNVFDTAPTFAALAIDAREFAREWTFDPYWRGEV